MRGVYCSRVADGLWGKLDSEGEKRIMANDISLQKKRPQEFDKWGAYVIGCDCKARCILRREDMISLLQYVLLLERRVAVLELEMEEDPW